MLQVKIEALKHRKGSSMLATCLRNLGLESGVLKATQSNFPMEVSVQALQRSLKYHDNASCAPNQIWLAIDSLYFHHDIYVVSSGMIFHPWCEKITFKLKLSGDWVLLHAKMSPDTDKECRWIWIRSLKSRTENSDGRPYMGPMVLWGAASSSKTLKGHSHSDATSEYPETTRCSSTFIRPISLR